MLDPRELTFERLQAEERRCGGPAWRAAVDAGIDVTMLEHNRHLTPAQRLAQLDEMLRIYFKYQR